MKKRLSYNEKVVADGGYQDGSCSYNDSNVNRSTWTFVRAIHEATNKRLKQFKILSHRFRHSLSLHADGFFAVANITQLLIESVENVFNLYG